MVNKKDKNNEDKHAIHEISDNDSELSYDPDDNGSDLDDFIDEDYEDDGTLESEEYRNVINKLREPKLHLNPYPTYNPDPKKRKAIDVDALPEFNNEQDRIKWLIENKLGPDMTLQDYVKYLKEQEECVVENFVRRSKRLKEKHKK